MTTTASALRRLAYAGSALLCSSMSFGCVAQAGNDGGSEPIGEAQQNLTGRWFYSWGTTNGPELNTNLPTESTTCFLSGVAGNLSSGDPRTFSYYTGDRSQAKVFEYGGVWWVKAWGGNHVHTPDNNPVTAHVTCFNSVANRTPVQTIDQGSVVLGPVTSNSRCFLTEVSGGDDSWNVDSDSARITQVNSSWVLSVQATGMFTRVSARCVDLPAEASVTTAHLSVADPGSTTLNWAYDSAGMACMLTGIKGHLNANSWSDGALLNLPTSFPGWWTLHLENGKSAWATCAE
jgi:hypothetical protein